MSDSIIGKRVEPLWDDAPIRLQGVIVWVDNADDPQIVEVAWSLPEPINKRVISKKPFDELRPIR